MKEPRFDEPLSVAAADSLKHAAKVARQRAREANVPLVIWKNGKIAYISASKPKPAKRRRA